MTAFPHYVFSNFFLNFSPLSVFLLVFARLFFTSADRGYGSLSLVSEDPLYRW